MKVIHEAQHNRWLFYPDGVRICAGMVIKRAEDEFHGMRITPTGNQMFSFATWDEAAAYVKYPHERKDTHEEENEEGSTA